MNKKGLIGKLIVIFIILIILAAWYYGWFASLSHILNYIKTGIK